jgi:hypothetical protein
MYLDVALFHHSPRYFGATTVTAAPLVILASRLSMFTSADIVDNDYIDMAFRCDMLVSWAISKICQDAKSAG